jgi:hypothetical protein
MHGDETGTVRVFEGLSIEQVEQYLLLNAYDYQVYITDIAHKKDSDIAKEWRQQMKLKEQEELMLRKADLDKREAALDAREARINAGLDSLRSHIDSLQSDLKSKRRKIRVTVSRKPAVSTQQPVITESVLTRNGRISNEAIGRYLIEYMRSVGRPVTTKEMHNIVQERFPETLTMWSQIDKGVNNVLQNCLKKKGLIQRTGRGAYTLS